MDRRTHRIYQRESAKWIAARNPDAIEDGRLAAFARSLPRHGLIADLGAGPGWYARWLGDAGFRVIALDTARSMLAEVGHRAATAPRVCGDIVGLPFRDRSLDGVWARACYQHVPLAELPMALARLHWALKPNAWVELTLAHLSERIAPTRTEIAVGEAQRRSNGALLRGRLFSYHSVERVRDLMLGAGFEEVTINLLPDGFWLAVRARRARTLPDIVGPRLKVLLCGLNPSLYSADRGVGFARPGNRFWPAARMADLVESEREPLQAYARGIGMTDLVKRATTGADDLRSEEYAEGLQRLERLVRVHRPRAVCFVGLDGWRKVVDRKACPGWIATRFGGRPAYLMPSTSGRNARVSVRELAQHLRNAAALPTNS